MLVDNISLTVIAGRGGNGSAHFRRDGQTAKGGPDGGNGGNGGDIYFLGSHNVTDLREFRYKKEIKAESGVDGIRQKMHGRNAEDLIITVPFGTRVTDENTGAVFEIKNSTVPQLIAKGGKGGLGNTEFKSATNQAPTYAEPGGPGQKRQLKLELRLIAQIGLIGLPNAGKSSLLSVLTNAKPAIGAYPFTTLEPNIGMLETFAIADIPGLIKGASDGKGLGVDFLRHIEKTKILIHCIDASTTAPKTTYDTIRKEFGKFNETLLTKPEYILITKTDLVSPEAVQKLVKLFTKNGHRVFTHSMMNSSDTEDLKKILLQLLEK